MHGSQFCALRASASSRVLSFNIEKLSGELDSKSEVIQRFWGDLELCERRDESQGKPAPITVDHYRGSSSACNYFAARNARRLSRHESLRVYVASDFTGVMPTPRGFGVIMTSLIINSSSSLLFRGAYALFSDLCLVERI